MGAVGGRLVPQPQRVWGHDGDRRQGRPAPGQDVEDDVCRVDAFSQRLEAGGLEVFGAGHGEVVEAAAVPVASCAVATAFGYSLVTLAFAVLFAWAAVRPARALVIPLAVAWALAWPALLIAVGTMLLLEFAGLVEIDTIDLLARWLTSPSRAACSRHTTRCVTRSSAR